MELWPRAACGPLPPWGALASEWAARIGAPPRCGEAAALALGGAPRELSAALRLLGGLWPKGEDALAGWLLSTLGECPERLRGARLAVLLPLGALGEPTGVWESFADALGERVELYASLLRVWRIPGGLAELEGSAYLDRMLARSEVGPRLRLALSGQLSGALREQEVRNLLAERPARATLIEEWEAWGSTLYHRVPDSRSAAHAPLLIDLLEENFRFVLGMMDFQALAALAAPGARWSEEDAAKDLAAAAADLATDPELSRSWEVKRWPFAGSRGELLVEKSFPQGLILQALLECGQPVEGAVRGWLSGLPREAPRWYGGWRGIPPDSDSLGLALQLAGAVGWEERGLVEGWLSVLRANLGPDLSVPTWLYRAPGGALSTDGPAWEFPGDACSSVKLAALMGLMTWDPGAWREVIEAQTAALLPLYRASMEAKDFNYTPGYTSLLFARFARRYADGGGARSEEVREVAQKRCEWIREAQRRDGGWGGPQESAFYLEAYATLGRDPLVLRCGLRYQSETQRPDGSWAPEPFYWMPGKSTDRLIRHQGRELTTAFCMRALAAASARLKEPLPPDEHARDQRPGDPAHPRSPGDAG